MPTRPVANPVETPVFWQIFNRLLPTPLARWEQALLDDQSTGYILNQFDPHLFDYN